MNGAVTLALLALVFVPATLGVDIALNWWANAERYRRWTKARRRRFWNGI